jgi:hypothetical protein
MLSRRQEFHRITCEVQILNLGRSVISSPKLVRPHSHSGGGVFQDKLEKWGAQINTLRIEMFGVGHNHLHRDIKASSGLSCG